MEELIKKLKSIYDKYTSMTNIHREVAEETKKIAIEFYQWMYRTKIARRTSEKSEVIESDFNDFLKEYYRKKDKLNLDWIYLPIHKTKTQDIVPNSESIKDCEYNNYIDDIASTDKIIHKIITPCIVGFDEHHCNRMDMNSSSNKLPVGIEN